MKLLFWRNGKSLAIVTCFGFSLLCSSCTWVRLEQGAETVSVKHSTDTASCKKLGETTVKVVAKVAGIGRSREKMEGELEILAKNAAENMGGDSVVKISDIENGRQSYGIYKCEK